MYAEVSFWELGKSLKIEANCTLRSWFMCAVLLCAVLAHTVLTGDLAVNIVYIYHPSLDLEVGEDLVRLCLSSLTHSLKQDGCIDHFLSSTYSMQMLQKCVNQHNTLLPIILQVSTVSGSSKQDIGRLRLAHGSQVL